MPSPQKEAIDAANQRANENVSAARKAWSDRINDKLARSEALAVRQDEQIQKGINGDGAPVGDPTVDENEEVVVVDDGSEVQAAAEPVIDDPEITHNGVTKKRSEWLALATKVANADTYLEEAVKQYQDAAGKSTQTPEATVDKVKEIAKRLREGNEEESASAVAELLEVADSRTRAASAQASLMEQGRLAMQRVLDENKDLAVQQELYQLATTYDVQMERQGKIFDPKNQVRNFELRYREAWRQVRAWYKKVTETATVNGELAGRTARKAGMPHVPGTTTRTPKTVVTKSQREDGSNYIVQERQRRAALRS